VQKRLDLAFLFLLFALPVHAQGNAGPQLEVSILASNSPPAGASVRAARVLSSDRKIRELLRSGFPAGLTFRLELWRVGGMFDELESSANWNLLVRYDAYSQQYLAVRRHGAAFEQDFGGYTTLEAAEADVMVKPYSVALRPRRSGARYYYNVVLDVEALSVSDLDELQRWLRGELQPAVRGKRAPLSALRRGLGTLLSRVLGGETRHYEARSRTFRP
jgi:hypothetical protein